MKPKTLAFHKIIIRSLHPVPRYFLPFLSLCSVKNAALNVRFEPPTLRLQVEVLTTEVLTEACCQQNFILLPVKICFADSKDLFC